MKLTIQPHLFIIIFSFSDLYSANKSYSDKLGKVTDYELQMDVFEDDPSAVAVVLYKKCFIHYVFNSKNQPVLEYVFEGKIKI